MVLIALTPAAPPDIAALAGIVISVMFGVIFDHTGTSTASTTHRVTVFTLSGS